MNTFILRTVLRTLGAGGLLTLAACGSDEAAAPASPSAEGPRVVQGAAVKGPLRNASIQVFAIDAAGNASGNAVCSTTTSATDGSFTLSGCPAGQFLLAVSSGGSYADEGDTDFAGPPARPRRTISLSAGQGFSAILPPNATTLPLTPYSMALWKKAKLQAGGVNFPNVYLGVAAQAASAFGFDPTSVLPSDPLAPSGVAARDQYAMSLGGAAYAIAAIAARTAPAHAPGHADILAFVEDFSDGRLDGRENGNVVMVGGSAIPTDINLNSEVRRYRNNNDAAYTGQSAAQVNEAQLSQPATPANTVNTAPSISDIADQVIDEDGATAALAFTVSDAETPAAVSLSGSSSNTALGAVISFGGSGANRTVTVTPAANVSGSSTITVTVSDPSGLTASDSFLLTVNPVADAPVANDDFAATTEDTAVTLNVLANDTDADGNALRVMSLSAISNGSAVDNLDGSVTFTPNANFTGDGGFTYTVDDGTGLSDSATVTVTVSAVNDAPLTAADSYSTDEDVVLSVPAATGVLANDRDLESQSFVAVLVDSPAKGSLSLNADGSFTYTPTADLNGSDSFTYRAQDSSGATSDPQTVSLTLNAVNDLPVSNDDAYPVDEDGSLAVPAAGVLVNDSDVEGSPLSAVLVAGSGPANGRLTFRADGSFDYTPNADFFGEDSFQYKASDGTPSASPATVTLTVNSINDDPVLDDIADTATDEDTPTPAIAFSVSDVETAAGALTLSASSSNTSLLPDSNIVLGGSGANRSITLTPAANQSGSATVTVTLTDAEGAIVTDTFVLTVNAVNDTPLADNDSYSTAEDTLLSVNAAAGALAGDTDAEAETLTAVLVSGVSNGSLTLNADGSFDYTPAGNFFGTDSFKYKAQDASGGFSPPATVTIDVSSVNDTPVAADDSATTNEDTPVTVAVLSNDSDPDNNPLSVSIVSASNGSAVVNANKTVTFTPAADFAGGASFDYRISDGQGGSDTATVTITVAALNDAPIAGDDSSSTLEDTPRSVNVLGNDTDAEGDTLTVVGTNNAVNGSATISGGNTVVFTPAPNFSGTASVNYTVADGNGGTDDATLTITVTAVNDAPRGFDATVSTTEDSSYSFLTSDFGFTDPFDTPDNNFLNLRIASAPSDGLLELNSVPVVAYPATVAASSIALGQFSFRPDADESGSPYATFPFQVQDDGGTANGGFDTDTAPRTMRVNVSSENDPAEAADDSYTVTGSQLNVPAPGVLANDTDPEGNAFTVASNTPPGNGSLVINADGSFAYTPNAGFTGTDSFTYTLSDGGDSATVSLVVSTPAAAMYLPLRVGEGDLTLFDPAQPVAAGVNPASALGGLPAPAFVNSDLSYPDQFRTLVGATVDLASGAVSNYRIVRQAFIKAPSETETAGTVNVVDLEAGGNAVQVSALNDACYFVDTFDEVVNPSKSWLLVRTLGTATDCFDVNGNKTANGPVVALQADTPMVATGTDLTAAGVDLVIDNLRESSGAGAITGFLTRESGTLTRRDAAFANPIAVPGAPGIAGQFTASMNKGFSQVYLAFASTAAPTVNKLYRYGVAAGTLSPSLYSFGTGACVLCTQTYDPDKAYFADQDKVISVGHADSAAAVVATVPASQVRDIQYTQNRLLIETDDQVLRSVPKVGGSFITLRTGTGGEEVHVLHGDPDGDRVYLNVINNTAGAEAISTEQIRDDGTGRVVSSNALVVGGTEVTSFNYEQFEDPDLLKLVRASASGSPLVAGTRSLAALEPSTGSVTATLGSLTNVIGLDAIVVEGIGVYAGVEAVRTGLFDQKDAYVLKVDQANSLVEVNAYDDGADTWLFIER